MPRFGVVLLREIQRSPQTLERCTELCDFLSRFFAHATLMANPGNLRARLSPAVTAHGSREESAPTTVADDPSGTMNE